jgi:hypothetical protein
MDLKITPEFPTEDLLRIVQNDPNSSPLELELARRLSAAIDLCYQDVVELKHYHDKVSRSLAQSVQVLSSC